MTQAEEVAKMLEQYAKATTEAFVKSGQAVQQIAATSARTEQNLRRALMLLGGAVAMQPGIDGKKLLADFDALFEASVSHDEAPAPVIADLRAQIARVVDPTAKKP